VQSGIETVHLNQLITELLCPRKGCEVLRWVCLHVCLSVRSRISKTTRPNFTKFSVHVTYGHGLFLLWRQRNTLCTSGFMDDVMCSHNGA